MKPYTTESGSYISIEAQDMSLFEFGLAGGPAHAAPEGNDVARAVGGAEARYGDPNRWTEDLVLNVPVTAENLAICSLAVGDSMRESRDILSGLNPQTAKYAQHERILQIGEVAKSTLRTMAVVATGDSLAEVVSDAQLQWGRGQAL